MAWSTPRTWVAGEYITAAQMNANVRDNLNAVVPLGPDAWVPWTPTLTNITAGNGTTQARYFRVGRTIHFRFRFLFGSTSVMGTGPRFSLPVTASPDYVDSFPLGIGFLADTGVGEYPAMLIMTTGAARIVYVGGTNATGANVTAAVPFAWGSADQIVCFGTYEALS